MATKVRVKLPSIGWLVFSLPTAMIGHHMHGGWFWTVMDFCFWPLAWAKWLICQDVSVSVIKGTFAFLAR